MLARCWWIIGVKVDGQEDLCVIVLDDVMLCCDDDWCDGGVVMMIGV
jgi:hypothetical protein